MPTDGGRGDRTDPDGKRGDAAGPAPELPVVDPGDPPAGTGTDGVAGVLLAAGHSRRFGDRNKLLAAVDGRPVVVRAARTLLAAGLPAVVVVLGHDARRVADALRTVDGDGRLALVGNPDHGRGRATSIGAGIRSVRGATAAVVALGDMPGVRPATVRRLVAAYRGGSGSALAAAHRGRRGNPVLFDARHFPALASLSGGDGGRVVLSTAEDAALVETGDPGVRRDVDEVGDLDRFE